MFVIIAFICSITSINTLAHSFVNKNEGYKYSDYLAGLWIISNTPQKSVFVTLPTIHSAPTDIGGRLRIISYINWPYSHGFNIGQDNVFSRVEDVENVYKTGNTTLAKAKYNAKYIFYGSEEMEKYPEAGDLFNKSGYIRLIYNQPKAKIYEILQ
ncbi:MAG: hypothetical protein GYA62_04320 [Bacteroidales bacterium]|nr:hypothetical protein [Bacteroidales bacterium]